MEVSLQEILDARESRARRQRELLDAYGAPIICFTMNIPGPEKQSERIGRVFRMGARALESQLKGENIPILHCSLSESPTGCTGYYIVDCPAQEAKRLTAELENRLSYGRLLDLDVLTPGGEKISRDALGLPRRKCLICHKDAAVCGRSRAHTVAELQAATGSILRRAIEEDRRNTIASAAVKSLLYEVCTTPKPGLVDMEGSGSHKDMDIFTFLDSASLLYPYFYACAGQKDLASLRLPGKLYEGKMYRATGGINTHKGAIFSLGIACAVVGQMKVDFQEACKAFCAGVLNDLESARPTHGIEAYRETGVTGVRGQAAEGFPAAVKVGLPCLEEGLRRGMALPDAGACALLHIVAHTDDTNMIARGGKAAQEEMQASIRALLEKEPFPSKDTIRTLGIKFREKNLSPGGSADMLALSYFLHFIKEEL